MSKIFHYIFSTYKRKQILSNEIAKELEIIFGEVCKEKGFKIINQSVLADHAHLLIGKKPSDRNEYVMKMIKGISAHRIFKRYSTNRVEFRKLWGRGYRAEEIKSEKHLKQVIDYIDEQRIYGVDKRAKPNWKPRRLVAGFQFKRKNQKP